MEKKRLFIGMLGACILLLSLLIYYIWQLLFSSGYFFRISFSIILLVFGLLTLLAAVGIVGLVWSILRGKNYRILQRPVSWTVTIFYPLILRFARLCQITQDRVQASFIEVNNKLVEARGSRVRPEKLLVLLPHCLQMSDCPFKVTGSLSNCRGCGRCTIGEFRSLARKYRVAVEVVPGGTLARRAVLRHRPNLVLAVACERDLSSGIIDSAPLPVYGLLNQRPHGPCFNTGVDVARLEDLLKKYLNEGGV